MQCPVCHSEAAPQSAFCPQCGASLSSAAPSATPPEPPAAPPPGDPQSGYVAPPPGASSGLSPNAAGAIAYFTFIPAVLFLIIEPYNKIPFVRFHSFQSIGLTIVAFVLHVAIRLVTFPFGFWMFSILQGVVSTVLFFIWLFVVLKASRGEWYKLPVIGDLALKQAQS